jgi:hypothetical protein
VGGGAEATHVSAGLMRPNIPHLVQALTGLPAPQPLRGGSMPTAACMTAGSVSTHASNGPRSPIPRSPANWPAGAGR